MPNASFAQIRRMAVGAVACAMTVACADSPAAPSAPPAQSPPAGTPSPQVTLSYDVSGTVIDERGARVSGAMAMLAPQSEAFMTDGQGQFSASFTRTGCSGCFGQSVGIRVSHPRYESTYREVPGTSVESGRVRVDNVTIVMRERSAINAGEGATLVVGPEDAAHGFDSEWWSRTLHVRAARAGTLLVEASSSPEGAVTLTTERYPYYPRPRPEPLLRKAVDQGESVDIFVLVPWTNPATVVNIATALE